VNAILITTEYITLGQCLKLIHAVSSGGESKRFLQSNDVMVNHERETRRGRKLYPGMIVTWNQTSYEVQREA
jgi:ribosome-associated protein